MHENDLNPFGPFMLFCVSDWVPSLSVFVRQERDVIEEGEVGGGHQQGAREEGRIGNDINSIHRERKANRKWRCGRPPP